jgi:23S rRNA (uracil1939-C5)-methyltransferase
MDPEGTEPRCVHFGACGGCQYQDIAYDRQIGRKREMVEGLLAEAGLEELPEMVLHAAAPWGYRNRVRMRIGVVGVGEGEVRVGYSRAASHEFLPVRMCPIAAPGVWRAAEALTELAKADALCRRWLAAMSGVEIFGDESRLQMSFFAHDAEAVRREDFAGFCERVKAAVPELAGAGVEMDPDLTRRARRAWDGASWGAAGLAYEAAGYGYWVSRGAFFQVNRFLVDELVRLATSGRSGELAWDLYAGVGLFSRALAERFAEVVAVEGAEVSARDLAGMARGLKTPGTIKPIHAATLDFLRAQVTQRKRPELIVMDPPRAGVGVEGCKLLGRMRVTEIVYVSCDPATLARDLKVLTGAGYGVQEMHLVDLFPQTVHVETVVRLGTKQ